MAYTTLTNSDLRIPISYGETDLLSIDTYNWDRLANTLLKLSAMLDVDVTGISDGNILKWSGSAGKWVDAVPTNPAFESTTTTTTTTTTTL